MKTHFLFALTVLTAAVFGPALSRAEEDKGAHFYLQPGFAFVSVGDDFKSSTAVMAAAGVAFARNHSVEAEGVFFKTEPDRPWPAFELRYSIALVTYKYTFRLRHGLSLFAGGSLGYAKESVSPKPGYYIWGERSDNSPALGLSGGVRYSLNPHVHFEAGTRLIAMDETRFTTSGSLALLQGSVRFQF